jgi:hypothetical protein
MSASTTDHSAPSQLQTSPEEDEELSSYRSREKREKLRRENEKKMKLSLFFMAPPS